MELYQRLLKRKNDEKISLFFIVLLNAAPIFLAYIFEYSSPDKYLAGLVYIMFLCIS
jgi:hypothetical protein